MAKVSAKKAANVEVNGMDNGMDNEQLNEKAIEQKPESKRAYVFEEQNGVLTWKFKNGAIVELDTKNTAVLDEHARVHGYKQKLGDAMALARNPETGASATIDDKIAEMLRIRDQLYTGNWNRPAGAARETGGLLAMAMSELKNMDLATAKEKLAAMTPDKRAALQLADKVVAKIAEIKRRKAPGVDANMELDNF